MPIRSYLQFIPSPRQGVTLGTRNAVLTANWPDVPTCACAEVLLSEAQAVL